MGQAKRRGTLEDRVKQAQTRWTPVADSGCYIDIKTNQVAFGIDFVIQGLTKILGRTPRKDELEYMVRELNKQHRKEALPC